jgi:hypothetical protein
MAKSPPKAAARGEPAKSPVENVRDCADALFRAAVECCHQADRLSRVSAKSAVDAEQDAASRLCEACNDSLRQLTDAYEKASADVHPTGADEQWWRRANAMWLASREFLRRHRGCDAATRELKQHGRDRLNELQTEYELEASALLALRHAADAYRQDRPSAA